MAWYEVKYCRVHKACGRFHGSGREFMIEPKRLLTALAFFIWTILLPLAAQAARPIMIQGAMSCETDWLIASLEHPQEERVGTWRFVSGTSQGIPVVVSVTSVGMVNAAASTALGIERFHPAAVINQGTAGGHDPALHTFDIVIGADSFDASAWISRQEKRGADGRHVEFYRYDDATGEIGHDVKLSADEGLLAAARSSARSYERGKVVVGTLATSNNWNRQRTKILFLHEQYGSSCEEMEAYAVARVCQRFGVPFIGVRILSNTELHGETFNPETGGACQEFALAVAKAYYEGTADSPSNHEYYAR